MISAGATISSTAVAPASTKSRTGAIASSIPGKWIQAVVVRAGSGTVSKTASATKPSVPSEPTSRRRKISSGSLGVEEGAEPVAGRVLDRELGRIRSLSCRVGADLVADRRQPGGQLGLLGREALGGVRRGRVDRRPRGQHEGQRADRRVGVPGRPAAHPAGVVGDHARRRRRCRCSPGRGRACGRAARGRGWRGRARCPA